MQTTVNMADEKESNDFLTAFAAVAMEIKRAKEAGESINIFTLIKGGLKNAQTIKQNNHAQLNPGANSGTSGTEK